MSRISIIYRNVFLTSALAAFLLSACSGGGQGGNNTVGTTSDTATPPPVGSTLTGVTLANNGAAGEIVATFGQGFRSGDVPAGYTLAAALADGTAVPLQVDKKATHADGSLRHAVLTARVANFPATQAKTLNLYATATSGGGTAVSIAGLLATNFDATVKLTLGAKNYSVSARNLLQTTAAQTWLAGPEVAEWIVHAPIVTNTADIQANPALGSLTAYFHVRAYAGYARVRVDAVVENNFTFKVGAGPVNYTATVTVGNNTIYTGTLAHPHHSRWHQVGWWGPAANIFVRPDMQYLRDTLLVPNYANLTLKDTVFSDYAQSIAPLTNANLRTNWGDPGYDWQIGLLPEWDAAFIISGDARAYNAVLANASAGGSYSYHYRDENTGTMPSLDTYPTLNEQDYAGGLIPGAGGNVYSHEPGTDPAAHQPMIGYLAYLLTGDYFYLEEMQFLANYDMIWRSPSGRTYLSGPQDGIVGLQNRGQAWGIRTLSHAAALTPDNHPLKNYLLEKTNNNIAEKTAHWAVPSKNTLGAIQDYDWTSGYTNPPKYSPWQNDFFVTVFGRLVDLGFTNAIAMRDWLTQWPVGRLGGNNSGFCWKYATQYNFSDGIVQSDGTYNTSFLQLYRENYPTESSQPCPAAGLMQPSAYPTEGTSYYANLQAALATAMDAGAAPQSLWDRFITMGTPDYTAGPLWAIVPRKSTPAWYAGVQPGQWYMFPNSRADAIDPEKDASANPNYPAAAPWHGIEGFAAIMNSWCGGAYDSKRDRLLIWGGGHNAYAGNEILAFDVMNNQWSRVTNPSISVQAQVPYYSPDGRPTARHTYNNLQYLPMQDWLLSVGVGSGYGETGYTGSEVDAFNFDSGAWQRQASIPSVGYESKWNTWTVIDTAGNVWYHSSGSADARLYKYTPATNTWSAHVQYALYEPTTAALDTKRNRAVSIGNRADHFRYWDLNNPDTASVQINASGAPSAILNTDAPGFVYDPIGDRFLAWNGGSTVYALDPVSFTWSTLTIAAGGTTPTSAEARGTYGRLRYVASLRGLVVVNRVNENVYFFRSP